MIFHKRVERELTQNEMNKYLKRPVAKEEFVAEGAHEATIESARAIVQSNPFTTLETELYDEVIRLKKAGISIKKVMNEAVGDLLVKYNII